MRSLGDTDDAMRLVEARALLHGRAWGDLIEPRLAPPAGLAVHWSRLVDAPIALMLGFFSLIFGSAWGETITRALWPVSLFVPTAWLWIKSAQKMGGEIAMWAAAAIAPLCFVVWDQFAPGRLDHHNVQLLLMSAMMFLALEAERPRNAAIMGGACALSIAVGFETLPVIVWAAGLIALRFVWSKNNSPAAYAFGLALAGVAGLAFLVQTPPAWWLRTGCDALAFNGVAGAALSGLALAGVARLSPNGVALRLAGAGVAGALGVAVFIALHPSCLHGPYADLDPRLNAIWLDRVGEARTFMQVLKSQPVIGIAGGLLPLGALIAACVSIARGKREPGFVALTVLLALTAVVGLIESRGMVLATAAAIPLAAAQLAQIKKVNGVRPMIAGLALGLFTSPSVAFLLFGALTPSDVQAREKHAVLDQDKCFETGAFAAMNRLTPGVVFADLDAGPHILAHTAHAAASAPYHRLGQPIYDAMTVFYGPAAKAEPVIARAGADYIALCRNGVFAQELQHGSFAEALLRGPIPAWLMPLDSRDGDYALFKVQKPGGVIASLK
ncbi:MAG TPA: hypothetical protein VG735_15400 [Caulobacterales bacterium]|nr:hypothetical protein [Caulobacterales bacterium]